MLPLASDQVFASAGDHARCRRMLREGSRSFYMASRLLPDALRGPVTVLYAFCRLSDDGVDRAIDKKRALERLKERMDRAYAGNPVNQSVDKAFADLVKAHPVPREIIDMLFEGFAWDTEERRYASLSDVRAYSVRVAGTVGALMALLMGVRDAATFARAIDLGVAMQLTNIARDVGEDANAARIYLPTDWFARAGMDIEAFLAAPAASAAVSSMVEHLLIEAQRLYRRSETGILRLPARCRPAIFAARYIYEDIGIKLANGGYDSVSARTIVGRWRKLQLAGYGGMRAVTTDVIDEAPPLAEARSLVACAVRAAEAYQDAQPDQDRVGWLFDILTRLAERDMPNGGPSQAARTGSAGPGSAGAGDQPR